MKILVPIDFSEPSHRAFQTALGLARRTGGTLLLVHAMAPAAAPGLDLAHPEPLRTSNAPQRLDPGVAIPFEWRRELEASGVHAEKVALPGLPAEVVMEQAERAHADLIVMGTHDRKGVERFLLGSVAERVLRESEVPVLVVPAHGVAPTWAEAPRRSRATPKRASRAATPTAARTTPRRKQGTVRRAPRPAKSPARSTSPRRPEPSSRTRTERTAPRTARTARTQARRQPRTRS